MNRQIADLIIELNKIALIRFDNDIGSCSKKGNNPENMTSLVWASFEGNKYEVYTDNRDSSIFKISVDIEDEWILLVEYHSGKNDEIIWSANNHLNMLAKHFLTEYKTLTENQLKNA